MNPAYFRKTIASPFGDWTLVGSDAGLRAVLPPHDRPRRVLLPPCEDGTRLLLEKTATLLREYWSGQAVDFALPLDLQGTPFQQTVWQALCGLSRGQTTTYGALAAQLGCPRAVRAVAAAIARNPLCVVLPCHRVIGAGGKLTGYAGGLAMKRRMLQQEGVPGF